MEEFLCYCVIWYLTYIFQVLVETKLLKKMLDYSSCAVLLKSFGT